VVLVRLASLVLLGGSSSLGNVMAALPACSGKQPHRDVTVPKGTRTGA
jgi:hypothetical protein